MTATENERPTENKGLPPNAATKPERRTDSKNKGVAGALLSEMKWLRKMKDAPTYRPTVEEFEDPLAYIRKIEPEASKTGICKIVPPRGFNRDVGLSDEFTFSVRHQKLRDHTWEHFGQNDLLFEVEKVFTLGQYRENAMKIAQSTLGMYSRAPEGIVEAEYWRQRTSENLKPMYVEYGNDLEGTAFRRTVEDKYTLGDTKWNLSLLGKAHETVLRHIHGDLPGITSPMLYIGALFATFFWHVEDHYMHSINYMHAGAAKTWYGVPGHGADGFEKVVLSKVYKRAMDAKKATGGDEAAARAEGLNNLLLKTTMFTPKLLMDADVPVYRTVQRPGEFVLTFPRSYHGGFSHGFNVGEAVNFALPEWFPIGRQAVERYTSLRTMQILPHEELLCREAISIGGEIEKFNVRANKTQMVVIQEYVSFIHKQRQLRLELRERGAQILQIEWPHGSNPCSRCNNLCFLSMVGGKAKPLPVCLDCATNDKNNNEEIVIYVRPSLPQFETLAGRLWRQKLPTKKLKKEPSSANGVNKKARPPPASDVLPDAKRQRNEALTCDPCSSQPHAAFTSRIKLGEDIKQVDLDIDGNVVALHAGVNGVESGQGPGYLPTLPGQCAIGEAEMQRFKQHMNTPDMPLSIVSREKVDVCWQPLERTILHNPSDTEEKYLLAGEVLNAANIQVNGNEPLILSQIIAVAEEVSAKLGAEPLDNQPLRAYYKTESGDIQEGIVLGRPEIDAILTALLDKAFVRVAMFQNMVWEKSLWNSAFGEN